GLGDGFKFKGFLCKLQMLYYNINHKRKRTSQEGISLRATVQKGGFLMKLKKWQALDYLRLAGMAGQAPLLRPGPSIRYDHRR
ncbi:hypothetical protein, partial [Megasphaera sp.]|uniref:hypothetical protein n=1 Tax=Megasphaera sp. TaxID=2023260 RepID=UPI003F7F076E